MRYGGIQPRMRENLLTQDGFGPFHTENCLLQTGMKQSIQYLDTDSGPCYFSTKEELKEGQISHWESCQKIYKQTNFYPKTQGY